MELNYLTLKSTSAKDLSFIQMSKFQILLWAYSPHFTKRLTVKSSILERILRLKKNNFLKDILDESGNIKTWKNILQQHKINKQIYFKWWQLIHTIPNYWEKEMVHDNGNCKNILHLNHHLIKNNQLHDFEKLNAKQIFPFQFSLKIPNSPHKNTFKITSLV